MFAKINKKSTIAENLAVKTAASPCDFHYNTIIAIKNNRYSAATVVYRNF